MKKQVIVIHGGNTFKSRKDYLCFLKNYEIDIEKYISDKTDWKPWLRGALGEGYEVILPQMPNKTNAKFEEWKIFFEKFFPFLQNGVILVGHSLGGAFLAKYLSKNALPTEIGAVFLIAAPYDRDQEGHLLSDFAPSSKFNIQAKSIVLYHSKDDKVVPFASLGRYQELLPHAKARIFLDRGHFNQETFPELADDIKNVARL